MFFYYILPILVAIAAVAASQLTIPDAYKKLRTIIHVTTIVICGGAIAVVSVSEHNKNIKEQERTESYFAELRKKFVQVSPEGKQQLYTLTNIAKSTGKKMDEFLDDMPPRATDPLDAALVTLAKGRATQAARQLQAVRIVESKAEEKTRTRLATVLLYEGNARYHQENFAGAVASYDQVLELKKDVLQAWLGRGAALRKLKRYADALTTYGRAINVKEDFPEAWYGRSVVLRKLKRFAEALATYERTIKLQEDFPEAWYGHGVVLASLGRYDEASRSFRRAVKLKDDFPEAWGGLGMILFRLGRTMEAQSSLARAEQLGYEVLGLKRR